MAYSDNDIETLEFFDRGYERDDVPVQLQFRVFFHFFATHRHRESLSPNFLIGHGRPMIYSMKSSAGSDSPRGMGFLFSRNRMNVVTSRARCLVMLVGSPTLFEPNCATPHEMRLANGFADTWNWPRKSRWRKSKVKWTVYSGPLCPASASIKADRTSTSKAYPNPLPRSSACTHLLRIKYECLAGRKIAFARTHYFATLRTLS